MLEELELIAQQFSTAAIRAENMGLIVEFDSTVLTVWRPSRTDRPRIPKPFPIKSVKIR